MTEENLNFENIEYHLITLFEKIEIIRREKLNDIKCLKKKVPIQVEIKTFEFWRSVIAESISSFVYTFLVCGANAASRMGNTSPANIFLFTAITSGFVMIFLTQFFAHISGAHVNPAVTIAMGAIKRISILRTFSFIIFQCGGGVAGAAFLYGITVPSYQENLSSAVGHPTNIFTSWERFGIEFTLTILVVLSYLMTMDTYRKYTGSNAITIGATYCACSFVFMPYLNAARALGPSFVLNKWDEGHWVDWLVPILAGLTSGLSYEYIFNPYKVKKLKKQHEDETSSIPSEDELNYDDIDKPSSHQTPKFHGSTFNTYRSANGVDIRTNNYCPSLFSAPPARLERVESIYGGTKSLCRSPSLTRANLNRSQSVYTKSNTAINRELLPKPGPLVPAQSLYPMRLNQQQQQQQQQTTHIQNQNVQNQLQQRSELIYGLRGITPGTSSTRNDTFSSSSSSNERPPPPSSVIRDNYSANNNDRPRRDNYAATESLYVNRNNPLIPSSTEINSENNNPVIIPRNRRPESVYSMLGSQARNHHQQQQQPPSQQQKNPQYPENRTVIGSVNQITRPPVSSSATIAAGAAALSANSTNFHLQHSPNPQYQ